MSKVFENVRLDFCHLTTPVFDKFKNRELYKALVKIPNTEENLEALQAELDSAVEYGSKNKASGMSGKPNVKKADEYISPDGQWISINVDSSKPVTVYDKYGDIMENVSVTHIDNAEVEMFGFVWVMKEMKKWGVKLYIKSMCVHDDLEAAAGGQFKFEKRPDRGSKNAEASDSDVPFDETVDAEDSFQVNRAAKGGLRRVKR